MKPSFPFKCVNCHTSSKLFGAEGHFSPPLPWQLAAESLTSSFLLQKYSVPRLLGNCQRKSQVQKALGCYQNSRGTSDADFSLSLPDSSHTASHSMFSQATIFGCQPVPPGTGEMCCHLCQFVLLSNSGRWARAHKARPGDTRNSRLLGCTLIRSVRALWSFGRNAEREQR